MSHAFFGDFAKINMCFEDRALQRDVASLRKDIGALQKSVVSLKQVMGDRDSCGEACKW